MMIYKWYEVWAEETNDIPYLLLLCLGSTKENIYDIIDPKENNKVIKDFPDYDSAKLWLLEDEFILVRERMLIDE